VETDSGQLVIRISLYWRLSVHGGAYLFTDKSLLERMMADHIQLPPKIWTRLNLAWVAFFVLSGLVNLYVAFNFDEATWVNFKLFGMLGLTVVFVVAQSIYLAKHAVEVKK